MDELIKDVVNPPKSIGQRTALTSTLLPAIYRDIAKCWKETFGANGAFADFVVTATLASMGDQDAMRTMQAFWVQCDPVLRNRAIEIIRDMRQKPAANARQWAMEMEAKHDLHLD